ncbi:hypothetical protein B0J13DRAFT_634591 [Dactylonectria estremocensis]|uniref:Uncharacterized protein n=1 Tax=Dactylonectria estremocensis TaxID=1079267 RepID=A0A9P9JJ68_9HYPO|nr:hypothetical protein B0J13DRAFT_634591 [Dactylonectria estremocensis]
MSRARICGILDWQVSAILIAIGDGSGLRAGMAESVESHSASLHDVRPGQASAMPDDALADMSRVDRGKQDLRGAGGPERGQANGIKGPPKKEGGEKKGQNEVSVAAPIPGQAGAEEMTRGPMALRHRDGTPAGFLSQPHPTPSRQRRRRHYKRFFVAPSSRMHRELPKNESQLERIKNHETFKFRAGPSIGSANPAPWGIFLS